MTDLDIGLGGGSYSDEGTGPKTGERDWRMHDQVRRFTVHDARNIRLAFASPPSLDPTGQWISIDVTVSNGTDVGVSPSGTLRINLAAFFVPADSSGPHPGDYPRLAVTQSISPGGALTLPLHIEAPSTLTGQKLVVTLVQEGNFWFHLPPVSVALEYALDNLSVRKWWTPEQEESVVFGNIAALNQSRFERVFSHGGKQRPLFLHLETVNICNLKCVICPYVSMERQKETMPMPLFERIIDDYLTMGGGDVGLTPSVGDIFLDKLLVERIRLLRTRAGVRSIGFVTNGGNARVFPDDDLAYVVNECTRINMSVYGLDEEENAAMTRRPNKYEVILGQMKRIVELNRRAMIVFAFRLLKPDAKTRAYDWMRRNFGQIYPHEILTSFGNWGGAIDTSRPLPFSGAWTGGGDHETVGDGTPCAYPLLHLKVAVNGDVKFCSCIDYDSHAENIIGNVKDDSLLNIYNGAKARRLWRDGLSICKGCTHYKPVQLFSKHYALLSDPIRNLGI